MIWVEQNNISRSLMFNSIKKDVGQTTTTTITHKVLLCKLYFGHWVFNLLLVSLPKLFWGQKRMIE